MGVNKKQGIIKVFKQEYMWGVIQGEDFVDYQFNAGNIADSTLLAALQDADSLNYRKISVIFEPSKHQNKNGEMKDIAIGITASSIPSSSSLTNDANSSQPSSKDEEPSISPALKERVYQALTQEEENKGRIILLSELVPLLQTHGINIKACGYKKAKAFLRDLGFADALPLGTNGADCIVINRELAQAFLHDIHESPTASLPSEDDGVPETAPVPSEDAVSEIGTEYNRLATSIANANDSGAKELLSLKAQIAFMESKGVRFELMSKDEAEHYLYKKANFFKLRAFRGGFERFARGDNAGKYRNLDFAWLVRLSEIDNHLRDIMRIMTSDIEQAARLIILEEVVSHESEPYGIVQDFLRSERGRKTRSSLRAKRGTLLEGSLDPYIAGLVERYGENNDYPIWAFLELITFGSLCWFFGFASDRYESDEINADKLLDQDRHILQVVKILRNACSHGNCILNCLQNAGDADSGNRCVVNWSVKSFVREIDGMSNLAMDRFLYDRHIYPIVTTLYAHQLYVEEEPYNRACKQLDELMEEMAAYRNCCDNNNNPSVFHAFTFLEHVMQASHGIG